MKEKARVVNNTAKFKKIFLFLYDLILHVTLKLINFSTIIHVTHMNIHG